MSIRVLISGGGTGGHIFPAIAIANEIKSRHADAEILFVGALGRMEMEKVPLAGYKIIGLPIAGLQRKLTLSNFILPFKLLKSILMARKIIRDFKPNIAIGVGGYASAALIYAASTYKVPILIQEQNSYAGLTNKWLSSKASKICVAYPNMEKYFPRDKIVETGNPVRSEICIAFIDDFPSFSAHKGVRRQWAEPQTGSSGMPTLGAKYLETKSILESISPSLNAVIVTERHGN